MRPVPAPYFIYPPIEQWTELTYPKTMPGRYKVSNYGRIFNTVLNRFVAQHIVNTGYYTCNLMTSDGGQWSFYVHRLVAWDWVLENRDIDLVVNHKDANKTNNSYWNLEWVTTMQNIHHALDLGIGPEQDGIHTNHILTENEVHMICKMLEDPKIKYEQIINKLNNKVSVEALRAIARGDRWDHISNKYNIVKRSMLGETSGHHVLSDQDVHRICSLLQDPTIMYDQIAEEFKDKCKVGTIIDIAHGNTWTHISKYYNIPKRQLKGLHGGEKHPNTKLTRDDVHKICKMLEDCNNTYNDIAKVMEGKITSAGVAKISAGKNWKEVSSQYNLPNRKVNNVRLNKNNA